MGIIDRIQQDAKTVFNNNKNDDMEDVKEALNKKVSLFVLPEKPRGEISAEDINEIKNALAEEIDDKVEEKINPMRGLLLSIHNSMGDLIQSYQKNQEIFKDMKEELDFSKENAPQVLANEVSQRVARLEALHEDLEGEKRMGTIDEVDRARGIFERTYTEQHSISPDHAILQASRRYTNSLTVYLNRHIRISNLATLGYGELLKALRAKYDFDEDTQRVIDKALSLFTGEYELHKGLELED